MTFDEMVRSLADRGAAEGIEHLARHVQSVERMKEKMREAYRRHRREERGDGDDRAIVFPYWFNDVDMIWMSLAGDELEDYESDIRKAIEHDMPWEIFIERMWRHRRFRSHRASGTRGGTIERNIIPPPPDGVRGCAPILSAFASCGMSSKSKAPYLPGPYPMMYGLNVPEVMLEVFGVWFACGRENQVTEIIASEMSKSVFRRYYQPVIEQYASNGNKLVRVMTDDEGDWDIIYVNR